MTIAPLEDRNIAESVLHKLETRGIHAVLHDQGTLQRFFRIKDHKAGFTVDVDKNDFLKTCDLVRGWDTSEHVLEHAVHCPQCSSSKIEYPQYTRKFLTPSFHLGLALALGLIPKEYYCNDGQYTWPSELKPEVPTDILGWPRKL